MLKKTLLNVAVIIILLLCGCGLSYKKQVQKFHSLIEQKPYRQEVLAKTKPFYTLDAVVGGVKLDCYPTALVTYAPNGEMISYQIYPEVEHHKELIEMWAHYYDSKVFISCISDPNCKNQLLPNLNIDYEKAAEVVSHQMSIIASIAALFADISADKAASIGQASSGYLTSYLQSQAQQQAMQDMFNQLSSINRSIQGLNQSGSVIDLGPSRADQIGSSFGQGFGAGIAVGMMRAEAEKALQEKIEFMKLYYAAQRLKKSLQK